jgi:hypothetical protein
VDRITILTPGGGLCWLTPDICVAQTQIAGQWQVVTIPAIGGAPTVLYPFGANDLCAGGGRWLGWSSVVGLVGSLGSKPLAGLRAAGPDGTLAYCPNYQSGRGLILASVDPAGVIAEFLVPGAGYTLDVQVLGPTSAIWRDGRNPCAYGVPVPTPALGSGRLRRVDLAGEIWLVYWAEGTGLVAQVDGATDGYVLESRPIAFNHDAVGVAGALVVAWSTTQGEGPNDLVTVTVDRTKPRQPLRSPLQQPTFQFSHPVLVRPFKAEGSGQPDLFTLGSYWESPDLPEPLPEGRLLLGHDSMADWSIPAGLRPFDLLLIECYRTPQETLEQSVARWNHQLTVLLTEWSGDCGLISQWYGQGGAPPNELWTVQEILDGLESLDILVNRSPRIKVIAPFAWDRANGIVAHPELQTAFGNLCAAAALAGEATLIPVPGPTPPDPPDPPIPPTPGFPNIPPIEVTMIPCPVAVIGPNGLYGSVDPSTKALSFTKTAVGDWETFTLELPDDRGRLQLTSQSAPDSIIGVDTTQYGSNDVRKLFYMKAAAERGNYESYFVGRTPNKLILAMIEYIDQGVQTQPYAGPNLTLREL